MMMQSDSRPTPEQYRPALEIGRVSGTLIAECAPDWLPLLRGAAFVGLIAALYVCRPVR